MAVQVLIFEEQPNFAALASGAAVTYQTIGSFSDPANPIPELATNRFYRIGAAQLANNAQGDELNDLMVNDAAFNVLRFVDFDAHEVNGRARLSVFVTNTAPNANYPTMNQVRFRGWEEIMIPDTPAPTSSDTPFVSWEQNPILPANERQALTDYLALLTASVVCLGVSLPGAGTRTLIKQKLIRRRGLSMVITAEFNQAATGNLP